MKAFHAVSVFLMLLSAGHILSAQESVVPDSLTVPHQEKPSFFTAPKQLLLLPDASQITLESFKSSSEFKGVPFQEPYHFPKTWVEFKHAFMAVPLPEEFALTERLYRNMERGMAYYPPLWLSKEDIIRNNTRLDAPVSGLTLSGGSLIEALYNEFSHEGKMKRKYDSIIAQDNIRQQVSRKYDIELVKTMTGFDDEVAQRFMKFCDFKSDSILQAKQYDVYIMIQDCLSQFIMAEQE